MINAVTLDTGFLITLIDSKREEHNTAKEYYKYFLDNDIQMHVSTIVVAEFSLKQPFTDLPIRNFRIIPFNFDDATCCAGLNVSYYRNKEKAGQRDAVKDDFKIIAQAKQQDANALLTEDDNSMKKYCDLLKKDGKVNFDIIPLSEGFDVSFVNGTGQIEMTPIMTG